MGESSALRKGSVRISTYAADMTDYTVKPLGPDTRDAFTKLVERHRTSA